MQLKTAFYLMAGTACLSVSGMALAFDSVKNIIYPSPGLYRIVTNSILKDNSGGGPGMTYEIEQDSATGNARTMTTRPGDAPVTNNYAGQGPMNQCIKPLYVGLRRHEDKYEDQKKRRHELGVHNRRALWDGSADCDADHGATLYAYRQHLPGDGCTVMVMGGAADHINQR